MEQAILRANGLWRMRASPHIEPIFDMRGQLNPYFVTKCGARLNGPCWPTLTSPNLQPTFYISLGLRKVHLSLSLTFNLSPYDYQWVCNLLGLFPQKYQEHIFFAKLWHLLIVPLQYQRNILDDPYFGLKVANKWFFIEQL